MKEIQAKEVRGKHGKIGYNVYFHFNQQDSIVIHCPDELSLARSLDEMSQICMQKDATFDDGNCCKSDCKCICPPNYIMVYAILIPIGLIYTGVTIGFFYSLDIEEEDKMLYD